MTDRTSDEVTRYDRLGPIARALVDDYDEVDLAAMLVKVQDELAAARAEASRYAAADSADAAVGSYAGRAEAAEQALAEVWHLADLIRAGAPWARNADTLADRILEAATARWPQDPPGSPDAHVYLSTGCFHGDHDYCKSMTGLNGAKRPGECKHCGAACRCGCHGAAESRPSSTSPEQTGPEFKVPAAYLNAGAPERCSCTGTSAGLNACTRCPTPWPDIPGATRIRHDDEPRIALPARCTCAGVGFGDQTCKLHYPPAPAATEATDRATRLARDILSTFVPTRDSTGMHVTHHQARALPHEMRAWQDALDETETP